MKKILLMFGIALFALPSFAQEVALKNNLLWDATLSPNLALEIGLAPKNTIDIYGAVNPFNFKDGKKFKHWYVQPEFRWWMCEKFNGTFIGVHAHGGSFLTKNLDLPGDIFPTLKDHRYEGYFWGAGVSIGHQWIIGKRWNLEASLGVGYARVHYDKFTCERCSEKIKTGDKNYFGPTKATVSFVYFFR